MDYSHILFDLDGTLTDPGVGITRSVAYALKKAGIDVEDLSTLYPFIGPPLVDSFMRFTHMTLEQARQGVADYREYFVPTGMYENEVYPGVRDMLQTLEKSGKTLIVATSKPEPFARRILEHFSLAPYFSLICGSSLDETRTRKGEVIAYALKRAGNPPAARCVMVGDREHDVLGARENGLACVGVTYGYGSETELTAAGAAHLCDAPQAVARWLTAQA